MIELKVSSKEFELITRSLRVLAVELADSKPSQAADITVFRQELQELIE